MEASNTGLATISARPAALAQWEQQLDLVKDMCCRPKNRPATPAELGLFFHQCRTRKLDPLTRQIYAIFRNVKEGSGYVEKMTIQTSIDGFRLTAQRTGEYRGQVGPFWCGEDGVWLDVWVKPTPPTAAKVGAIREGFKEPVWGVARFDAYAQFYKGNDGREFPTGQWGKMPDTMVAKCAEAMALRKAFPDELSGLYTDEEAEQMGDPEAGPEPKKQREVPPMPPKVPGPITQEDIRQAVMVWLKIQRSDVNSVVAKIKKALKIEGQTKTEDFPRLRKKIEQLQDAGVDLNGIDAALAAKDEETGL